MNITVPRILLSPVCLLVQPSLQMEQVVILSSSGTHFRKPVWLLEAENLSLSPGADSSRICKLGRNRKVSPQDLPFLHILMGFPGGSVIKNLPAMKESQEKQVQSLGQDDPLEEGMATHSSVLTWKIPWTEKPCGQQSVGLQRVGHNCSHLAHIHTS